jgi:hypothetical protein
LFAHKNSESHKHSRIRTQVLTLKDSELHALQLGKLRIRTQKYLCMLLIVNGLLLPLYLFLYLHLYLFLYPNSQ